MTEKTLSIIHQVYVDTRKNCQSDVASVIARQLYDNLSTLDCSLDAKEQLQFDNFLLGVKTCAEERAFTFEVTNLAIEILNTAMIVQLWLNSTRNLALDVNFNSRRKSLRSELTKLLRKANSGDFCSIADRFGIRATLLGNIRDVYTLSNAFLGIVAQLNRSERADFMNWLEKTQNVDMHSKEHVLKILNLPFIIITDETKDTKNFKHELHPDIDIPEKTGAMFPKMVKDYILKPKYNGYQSLHFTLGLSALSPILPGTSIELQFRTKKMHDYAVHGAANHVLYKEKSLNLKEEEPECSESSPKIKKDILLSKTFEIDRETLIASGLFDYDPETDIDGVNYGVTFYKRHLTSEVRTITLV